MKRADFHYELPPERIAYYPTDKRTESRLMVVGDTDIAHRQFSDVLDYLQPNDCLVVNTTKVFPARIFGKKATGGKVEILVERLCGDKQALVHLRASKTPKIQDVITCEGNSVFRVDGREDALFKLTLLGDNTLETVLQAHGHVPLPPYIARLDELSDRERYQTVYAKHTGSVAAPTAGLHFDDALLARIKEKGVTLAHVTLHVGAGTFVPVRTENLAEHVMHAECIEVSQATCDAIARAKATGGRVIAVGTTTTRALETAARSGKLAPFAGETRLFLYPGATFYCVDAMITNFHLPESSLLMLVSAFAGYDRVMRAYRVAIEEKYRFFSYGDAMWLNRV